MNLDAEFWEMRDDIKRHKTDLERLLKRLKEQHSGEEIRGEDIPNEKNITINDYLTKERGAVTGTYTQEEADKWIAEYKEALGLEE